MSYGHGVMNYNRRFREDELKQKAIDIEKSFRKTFVATLIFGAINLILIGLILSNLPYRDTVPYFWQYTYPDGGVVSGWGFSNIVVTPVIFTLSWMFLIPFGSLACVCSVILSYYSERDKDIQRKLMNDFNVDLDGDMNESG